MKNSRAQNETRAFVDHIPGRLRLRNKRCLVVGANTPELGVIARLFAIEGGTLMLVDRDAAALKDLAQVIESEGGASEYRVFDPADIQCLERFARAEFNRNSFDVLIEETASVPASLAARPAFSCVFALRICTRISSDIPFDSLLPASPKSYHRNLIEMSVPPRVLSAEGWPAARQMAYVALFLASDEANLIGNSSMRVVAE